MIGIFQKFTAIIVRVGIVNRKYLAQFYFQLDALLLSQPS